MTRKEKTTFLSNLLIQKLNGPGNHYAKEVSVDYGTTNVKRVDFMQFKPAGAIYTSDIEKGVFTCYEVKSCKDDVYSGNGLNFLGEKNYIVTTMECYKSLQEDMRTGKLTKHIKDTNPESSTYYGIMVAVPYCRELVNEYENPTPLDKADRWELKVAQNCRIGPRKRSTVELLFCMLRSGKM